MPTILSYFLEALDAAHGWDYALTAAVSAMGVLMGLIGYLLKKRMEAYDKHLEECTRRAVLAGRSEERLRKVEKETTWVGNCIIAIGTKLGADLPPRSSD